MSAVKATGGQPGHCSPGGHRNPEAAPEQTKRCCVCRDVKPLTEFNKSRCECRECSSTIGKKYYEEHAEEMRVKNLLKSKKRGDGYCDRSRLSKAWVKAQLAKGCPVFSAPFAPVRAGSSEMSPQIDQFIPQGGYDEDNCWIISKKANQIKSNGTPEEIMQVAAWTQIVARFNRKLTQDQFVRLRARMNRTLLLAAAAELDIMAEEVDGATV